MDRTLPGQDHLSEPADPDHPVDPHPFGGSGQCRERWAAVLHQTKLLPPTGQTPAPVTDPAEGGSSEFPL